jgi:hypothetical protein
MRHLLSYLALVGIPLLGLLGVLQVGERLSAPAAVHGAYALTLPPPQGPCLAPAFPRDDPRVVIAQSGPIVQVRLGGPAGLELLGRTDAGTLSASGPLPHRRPAGCVADSVTFDGTVTRTPDAWLLAGSLRLAPCDSCTAVSIAGVLPRRAAGAEAR